MKIRCEELTLLNEKKDNLIEVFLFFLNNIQVFLKNNNFLTYNQSSIDLDIYTLKGVMSMESIEFKQKLTIIETYLFNLCNDIEYNGLDFLKLKNESKLIFKVLRNE